MEQFIGQTIKRYHILEKLGEGGMALVYKAHDLQLNRDVAIKIILPDKGISEKFIKRFQREAKALAALNHENIIPIIDFGEHDNLPYLVMPFIPGGTLKKQIGTPVPYDQAAKMLIPIAGALAYAHQKGVIHRDVKPANILIDETGRPLLSDFGVAKMLTLEETMDLTGTGVGVGTPEYMSPEQTLGKAVDSRADEYSLGIILYEMITGRKPYQADTPLAVAIKQNTQPLPDPGDFVPRLPDRVEEVLRKVLAKNPEDRYASMELFAEALSELAAGNLAHTKKKKKNNPATEGGRWKWVALLGTLAVLAAGGVILALNPNLFAPEQTPAPENTANVISDITPSPLPSFTPALPTFTATLPATPTLGMGSNQFSLKDEMEMVFVPAGEFTMGSPVGEGDPDEQPEHTVTLDAFWIDKTEVTNAMYQKCFDAGYCTWYGNGYMNTNSSNMHEDYFTDPQFADYPVINISVDQAINYCQWQNKTLPTEAQWEKAASGPENTVYPWGSELPDSTRANYNFNSNDTAAVGSYPAGASVYGALDMAGNVWEWTLDIYDSGYYLKSPPTSPLNQGSNYNGNTVIRGGSYQSNEFSIRNSRRANSDEIRNDIGFRCVSNSIALVPTKTPVLPTPTLQPEAGITKTGETDAMTMVFIPAGDFIMGSDETIADENPGFFIFEGFIQFGNESTAHTVNLDSFWIDQTEVTNEMFLQFVNATNYVTSAETDRNDSNWRKPEGPGSGLGGIKNDPVEYVSQQDAIAYCTWAGKRLPTEQEWEKAARGTDGRTYPWGEALPTLELANYALQNGDINTEKTLPVGSYPAGASPYGVLDMAGNVSEWVIFDYMETPTDQAQLESYGIESAILVKGGAWDMDARYLRPSAKILFVMNYNLDIGFRCAMDAD